MFSDDELEYVFYIKKALNTVYLLLTDTEKESIEKYVWWQEFQQIPTPEVKSIGEYIFPTTGEEGVSDTFVQAFIQSTQSFISSHDFVTEEKNFHGVFSNPHSSSTFHIDFVLNYLVNTEKNQLKLLTVFKNLQYAKDVIPRLEIAPPPPSAMESTPLPSTNSVNNSEIDARIQELLSKNETLSRQPKVEDLSAFNPLEPSVPPAAVDPVAAMFGGGGNPLGMLGGMMGMMGGEGIPGISAELFQALASGDEQGLANIDFIGMINGVINTLTELRDKMVAEKEAAEAGGSGE